MGKRHIPRHLSPKAKKKSMGATVAVLAVCFVLPVILIGAVIGRYQQQLRSDNPVRAREFYFTSDFLDGGAHTLAPETTQVSFTLGNHADDLRFSEVDITYEVTVTPTDGSASGVTVEYGNTAKKLAQGQIQDDTVTIQNLKPGHTYTIEAKGTGGYEKTLTAAIEVLSTEPAVYKHLDTTNPEYVLLTVWAQGYQGEVTIAPPSGLIPDNTDPVMDGVQTDAAFTDRTSFQDSGYCSHTYRFFGSGVTANDFEVTYGSGQAATVKAPS